MISFCFIFLNFLRKKSDYSEENDENFMLEFLPINFLDWNNFKNVKNPILNPFYFLNFETFFSKKFWKQIEKKDFEKNRRKSFAEND